jgi:hypothetical protein
VHGGSDLTCPWGETIAGDGLCDTYSVCDDSNGSSGTWVSTWPLIRQSCGRGYGGSGRRPVASGSEEDRGAPGAGEYLAERS